MCCEYSGAVLKIIPLKDNGELEIKKFESLLSEKKKKNKTCSYITYF